jgi:NAD(P)H-binding
VAFHLLLGRVYDDKDVQERIVRNSKLDWVIVRPVILTDGLKTNASSALVDPRDWTCGFISRADVADFLVKRSTMTPFCIRRRYSRAPSLLRGVSPGGRRAAEQRSHDDWARRSSSARGGSRPPMCGRIGSESWTRAPLSTAKKGAASTPSGTRTRTPWRWANKGTKGGKARAKAMTKAQRRESAQKAARARWRTLPKDAKR